MNATIYPDSIVSSYNFRGLFNSVEDCPDPKLGDTITTDSGVFVHNGSCWEEVSVITTNRPAEFYLVNDRYYSESEPKMIPVSTCRYCGAPVNNDGECEYCGIKHQYIFN